jgi:hypothetical protein
VVIVSDKIIVSELILTEYFCCDLQDCKGACCIEGDSGAPLSKEECNLLDAAWERYLPYMQRAGIEAVKQQGRWVVDIEDEAVTPLIGKGDCAYSYIDKDTCMCALEKYWTKYGTSFRKPISCWLYPIRVQKLSNGTIGLNYHRWHVCSAARELGAKKNIKVFEFCKDPLIHSFGEDVYRAISMAADTL